MIGDMPLSISIDFCMKCPYYKQQNGHIYCERTGLLLISDMIPCPFAHFNLLNQVEVLLPTGDKIVDENGKIVFVPSVMEVKE